MSLGISEAQLIALFLESVFWGIHFVTFISCLNTLFRDVDHGYSMHARRNFIVGASSVLLLVATFDVALLVHNVLDAFIYFDGPGGATERFDNMESWNTAIRAITLLLVTMVGDGILVWRCWELHQRVFLPIIFPALLWGTCIGLGIAGLIVQATADENVNATSPVLAGIITSYWACTFVLNLSTTGIIVLRLWNAERRAREVGLSDSTRARKPVSIHGFKGQSRIMDAIYTMIESGLLFTVGVFLCLITHVALPNALFPVSDVLIQIAGIAFNLIIIRSSTRASHSTLPHNRSISLRNIASTDEGRHSSTTDYNRPYPSRMEAPKAVNVFVETSTTSQSDEWKH